MNNRRIHILGASGTGTTTLGTALARELALPFFDTDAYYWLHSDPPFTHKRPIPERLALLQNDLALDAWVLSGSLCSWGDAVVPRFTHVIFLRLDNDIRLERLRERERSRYGRRIEEGGDMRHIHEEFMAWCNRYETGGAEVRSLLVHEQWLAAVACPVLRLRSENSVGVLVREVVWELETPCAEDTDVVNPATQ